MTNKVNELLTAKTTADYFKVCSKIANELEQYSKTAGDIFYQLHNIGLVDIVFNGDLSINFIIEGIIKTTDDIYNLLKWVNDTPIKITKNNFTNYIIVKVVL